MLSLRLKSGLNYSEFEEKFGYTLPSYIIKKAKEYEKIRLYKCYRQVDQLYTERFSCFKFNNQ